MSTTTRPRPARRSAAVFVAGLLTLTAAACGTSGPGSSGKAGDATMWALQTGDQPVLEGAIKEWNEQHPDAGIKVNFFSSDAYKPKIRTAVGAKQAPTLIYSWGGGVLKSYVDAGAVADLSGYQKKYPELFKRYLPSTLKNNQFDGKTYALPFNKVNPVFLYYNKSVFADAGVQPPKTWDDLLELVPVFKKKGIAPLALGGQSKWPSLMYLEYLVDRIGGSNVFQRVLDGKPGAWSDPAVIKATTMIQQLVKAGGFADSFASTPSDSGSELALMYTGKAAMVLQLSSQYQMMKETAPDFMDSGDLGWVPFPTVEGGTGDPRYLVGTPANSFAISSDATEAQRNTAMDFLADKVLDKEYSKSMIDSGGVPPTVDVGDSLKDSDDKDFLGFTYNLVHRAPAFQLSWDQSLSPGHADTLLSNLERVFLLQMTPRQFSAAMDKTL
ncbi:raffinose/stachyose/melibiose transport system substrate-binding protein [Streptomyces sp. SAI-119]|uniref:ABC transporter substrate-binding protein n=2 Tax=unclassified Streptomyces TaxID=2593676 RepID=UPI00247387EF|nr:extracellular solute-binding protein [Streptomyces sp. SAI-119]MDH6449959.1 raffinose/stachyose/melibiose transport system substrate-binding protein [Streptomyces sp. SAI-119]